MMDVTIIRKPSVEDIIKVAAIAKTAYHSMSYQKCLNNFYEKSKKTDELVEYYQVRFERLPTKEEVALENAQKFLMKLINMGHESSIEPLVFVINVSGVSRVLTHQLVRHRMASFMQKSMRRKREFTVDDFVYPEDSPNADKVRKTIKQLIDIYEYLCKNGETPDDARRILPIGMATEITLTINARSLRNFMRLRLDKKASWEIRELAGTILLYLLDDGFGFLFRDITQELNTKDKGD